MKNLLIGTVIGMILVGLILAGLGYFLLNRPLAPGLKLTPAKPVAISTEAPAIEPAAVDIGQAISEIVPTEPASGPAVTDAPLAPATPPLSLEPVGSVCGSGAMTMMMLGEGSPHPNERRGADAIRLLRIDFDRQEVTILSIPANLWVKTSILTGYDSTTLTQAYFEVKYATAGNDREAIQMASQVVAQALLDNFGFVPDHFMTINEPVFVSLVNTLGGIEVNIPERIDGSEEGRGIFEAGRQVLTGKRTLDYIRINQPNDQPKPDEWGRFERQNQILAAIQKEIKKPENAAAMPALIKEFYQLVVTDLNPAQMLALNCMIDSVGDNITMQQVGSDMVTIDSSGHMIPDEAKIRSLIETSINQ